METLAEFVTDERIIRYLCRIRVKYAKKRNKLHSLHLLTNEDQYNYHKKYFDTISDHEKNLIKEMDRLLPCRRKWKKLGEQSRYKVINDKKIKISSTDKNMYSLIKTIKYYRKKYPQEPFVENLNNFVADIKKSIASNDYSVKTPEIMPKPKEKGRKGGICRPISHFILKDRIILSLTNKYLTKLFDPHFEQNSVAFRANNSKHHEAIKRIEEYKDRHRDTSLWVIECDIQKFFDTTCHRTILRQFYKLILKVKSEYPEISFDNAINIFKKYLECYSFNRNVKPLNGNPRHWDDNEIKRGEYGWVKEKELIKHHKDITSARIGVPQGGALSGLIANIMLDYADKRLSHIKDLCYVRYCDDMIAIHPKIQKCVKAKNAYCVALQKLKLIHHTFSNNLFSINKFGKKSIKPFWREKTKSKGPYKWDSIDNNGFPWIGFVGYEIDIHGNIRVRRRSLNKEIKKQDEVVSQIRKAVEISKRMSNKYISTSAIKRMIGMSIGKIELWNCKHAINEMCWKNGFKMLNKNMYSSRQMKQLDRHRNKLYYSLIKHLETNENKIEEAEKYDNEIKKQRKANNHPKYNKPFSYYYQVIERHSNVN